MDYGQEAQRHPSHPPPSVCAKSPKSLSFVIPTPERSEEGGIRYPKILLELFARGRGASP
jgi:hypothetical protein